MPTPLLANIAAQSIFAALPRTMISTGIGAFGRASILRDLATLDDNAEEIAVIDPDPEHSIITGQAIPVGALIKLIHRYATDKSSSISYGILNTPRIAPPLSAIPLDQFCEHEQSGMFWNDHHFHGRGRDGVPSNISAINPSVFISRLAQTKTEAYFIIHVHQRRNPLQDITISRVPLATDEHEYLESLDTMMAMHTWATPILSGIVLGMGQSALLGDGQTLSAMAAGAATATLGSLGLRYSPTSPSSVLFWSGVAGFMVESLRFLP